MTDRTQPPHETSDERTKQFVKLLAACDRRLYAYVMSLVVNLEDADEIVQNTKLKLWEQFDRFERGTDFAAWACTVGYYEVLSFRNARAGEREQFGEAFVQAVAAQAAEVADTQDARRRALSVCLEKLDAATRAFVLRSYTAGVQIKDVAAEIGRSVTATYQYLWRTRKRLHDCVEQELRKEDQP